MADLTSVAAVKAYLGLAASVNPAQDELLAALVRRASVAIENYCQRALMQTPRSESRDGTGGSAMMLREYPVIEVASVAVDGQALPATQWAVVGRTLFLHDGVFPVGRGNVRIDYLAGYDTVPADVEQACIETVALMLKRRDHLDVSSKALGGETVAYVTADLTPSARQMLSNYRIVAPF